MRVLIDDGMQIKVGTGIGKYSEYLYNELKKRLYGNDEVILSSFSPDKGNRKISNRVQYLLYINSKKFRDKCQGADIVHFTSNGSRFSIVYSSRDIASCLCKI